MRPIREQFDSRAQLKSKIRDAERAVQAQVRQSEGARPNFLHTHPRVAVALAGAGVALGVLTFANLRENGGDRLISDAVGAATEEGIGGVKSAGGVAVGAGGAVVGEVLPDCVTLGDAQVGSVEGCNDAKSNEPLSSVDVPQTTADTIPELPAATPEIVSATISVAEGAGGFVVARQCLGLDFASPITDAVRAQWDRVQSLPENVAALSNGLQTGETIVC